MIDAIDKSYARTFVRILIRQLNVDPPDTTSKRCLRGAFEANNELLHIVIDQCYFVVTHEHLHDISLYPPFRAAHLVGLDQCSLLPKQILLYICLLCSKWDSFVSLASRFFAKGLSDTEEIPWTARLKAVRDVELSATKSRADSRGFGENFLALTRALQVDHEKEREETSKFEGC
jgi:hypothetical protein